MSGLPGSICEIPELAALNAPQNLIRIPDQIDVPVTSRIMKLIDTEPFQRLRKISQLGLVAHVYPAAVHNRFEHSLGVYRNSLLFLRQLSANPRFCEIVSPENATALIVAALLHDVAHWPFCHPVEDMQLSRFGEHESLASDRIRNSDLAGLIQSGFKIDPDTVIALVERKSTDPASQLLCSILSGPIDVDKMDYLYRDSLHAGVPYGRNFDAARLIGSLCLNADGTRLAITHKGRTAAELMVFARYVMFSEVYWHHAVRSATAMFQRGFCLWQQDAGDEHIQAVLRSTDTDLIARLLNSGDHSGCFKQLFGPQRSLYKRLASYSFIENESLYRLLARRPYEQLVACSRNVETLLATETGLAIPPGSVLIDAPPAQLEVQFNVDVYFPSTDEYRPLGDVSRVVETLARQQFDDYVKQVRVFASPELRNSLRSRLDASTLNEIVRRASASLLKDT